VTFCFCLKFTVRSNFLKFPPDFREIQKFPIIPNGNSGSLETPEFPGFPEWEFPVALAVRFCHSRSS